MMIDLDTLQLAKGAHDGPDEGMCLLEAVAYVAREKFSDHPECASPILGAFGRTLNDVLPNDKRQRLVPLVPEIVGTAGDGHDQERGLMAADWLIRTFTPTWLRLAGLIPQAEALESLSELTSWDDLDGATRVLLVAKEDASAAGAAAWDAAGDAAWAAAGDAAWAAAGAAAGDAAWDAAGAAAWAAAGAAAGAAARDAARAALQPTVDELQDSAIELYERMVTVGKP